MWAFMSPASIICIIASAWIVLETFYTTTLYYFLLFFGQKNLELHSCPAICTEVHAMFFTKFSEVLSSLEDYVLVLKIDDQQDGTIKV